MLRLASLILLCCPFVGFAANPPRREPIHDTPRVFTADQFRDYLKTLQFQQALDKLSRSRMSEEQRQKLADFSQRLLEQSQTPGEKKDLPVPEELLKNPAIKKLLEDERFLEKLLENKALMDLAERIARNYNFPNTPNNPGNSPFGPFSPPGRTAPGARASGSESANPSGARQDRQRPPGPGATPGSNGSNDVRGNEDPNASRSNESPIRRQVNQGGTEERTGSSVTTERSGETPAGGSQMRRSNLGAAGAQDGRRHSILRQLTDNAQRSGVLKESRALERFEQRLEADSDERSYIGPRVDQTEPPAWPSVPTIPDVPSAKAVEQWIDRVGKISLKDVNLPPGLADWAPTLGSIPMPRLPNRGLSFAAPPIPQIPAFALSPPTARGSGAFAGVLVGLALLAFTAYWLRSRFAPSMRSIRLRDAAALASIRPKGPLDVGSRSSIQAWFEYWTLMCLGQKARARNHLAIARELREKPSADARSAIELVDLYEQARYLPPDEPINPNLAQSNQSGS